MKKLLTATAVAVAMGALTLGTTPSPAAAIPSSTEGDAARGASLKARLHAVYCAAGGDRYGCGADGKPVGDLPPDDYLALRALLCDAHPTVEGCDVPPLAADVAASR